jgi:hypothetical protein
MGRTDVGRTFMYRNIWYSYPATRENVYENKQQKEVENTSSETHTNFKINLTEVSVIISSVLVWYALVLYTAEAGNALYMPSERTRMSTTYA